MITAAALRPFKMGRDMVSMLARGTQHNIDKLLTRIETRADHEIERQQHVGDPDPDIHRAHPVDAESRRVEREKIKELVAQLAKIISSRSKAFRSGPRQDRAQRKLRQVLQPTQLPRHLHISAGIDRDLERGKMRVGAPAVAGTKIELPVDRPI